MQEKLTAALNDINDDAYIEPSSMTVSQWLNIWLKEYKKNSVKPATYYRYSFDFIKYVNPAIGSVKLKDLRPDMI